MSNPESVASEYMKLKPGTTAVYSGGGWIKITENDEIRSERVRAVERRIRVINRRNIEKERGA